MPCNSVSKLKPKVILKFEREHFKGTVSWDFLLLVLSWISFPPVPECSIKTVSNFFENSRRYSQLKVCHRCQRHRWQMEKIFNQKNFNNFVWSPLGSRGNIYINFAFKLTFRCQQPDIVPIICHRCQWHQWQICTLTCEYLREFSKKFEMILRLLSGAWGKVIHEKKPVAKNLVTLSL